MVFAVSQGSVVSAIGHGINSVIRAIASVLETIIGAIVTVRTTTVDESSESAYHLNILSQVILSILSGITDILCCRFGKRRRSTTTKGTTTKGTTATGRRGHSRPSRRKGHNGARH